MATSWAAEHSDGTIPTMACDPLHDRPRDADDGDIDPRVEACEEMGHAEVGAAERVVVRIGDQPHSSRAILSSHRFADAATRDRSWRNHARSTTYGDVSREPANEAPFRLI